MNIEVRARRSVKSTLFFVENFIWRIAWLEVLPEKHASSIERPGVLEGLWHVSASLYSEDKIPQNELDYVIHQTRGLSKGGKPQIALRNFIMNEMKWFEATSKPAMIDFSCDESKQNIEILMKAVFEISDYVRTKEFEDKLVSSLLECEKIGGIYESHYNEIFNRHCISDYCVGNLRIPRLRAEITRKIRRFLSDQNFITEYKNLLLRGKILASDDEMALTFRQRSLQRDDEFEDLFQIKR